MIFSGTLLVVLLISRGKKAQRLQEQSPAENPTITAPTPTQRATVPPAMAPAIRPTALSSQRGEWSQEIGRPQKITIGSQDQANGYAFEVELVTQGAAINTLKLSRHFATVQDKRLYAEDPAGYEAAKAANPKKYKGRYSLLNPVAFGSSRYLPLATRKVTVTFAGRKESWTLDGRAWKRLEGPTTGPDGAQWVSFSWTVWRDLNYKDANTPPDRRKFLRIIKTYSVRKGDQSVSVHLEMINHSQFDLVVTLDQYGPTGLSREDLRTDARKAAYAYLNPAEQVVNPFFKPRTELAQTQKVNSQVHYKYPSGKQILLGNSGGSDPLLWLGLSNKFFGSFMYLIPAADDRLDATTYKSKFYLIPAQESAESRTFLTAMTIPDLQIAPGGSAQFALDLFAGPKKLDMFTEKGAKHFKPLYKALGYKNTIELRSCSWAPLAFGMMWLLQKLSIVALGNYGVAIIVLVLLVRIALHPLTKKGQISMMKMQKLAPQMAKLKEKYKDDKESLNKEMMRFYRTQGASPLLGCLPMFLQLPIWIALFTALNASVDLRHAAFLPVWITDLAGPDALFGPWEKGVTLPLFGAIHSFNLLPLLLTAAFFVQARFNPQMSGQASANPDQARQQQMMMKFMMPGMMLVFFYNAPSGLTLYIMASTFAGIVEQIVIRKHIREKEAAEAAVETKVHIPGKGPRSSRPKKPKGPLWFKHG